MAYCLNCGTEVTGDMAFCPNCGAPVPAPASQATGTVPPHSPSQAQVAFANAKKQVTVENVKRSARTADRTSEFDADDISSNMVSGLLPYFLGWLGIIIALCIARNSKYVIFQIKQYLKIDVVVVFFALIVGAVGFVLGLIILLLSFPLRQAINIIVLIVAAVIVLVYAVFFIAMAISRLICFFNACKGRAKEAPFVSSFGFLN